MRDVVKPVPTVTATNSNPTKVAAAVPATIKMVVFKIANPSATKEPGPVFKVLHSFGKGADGAGSVAGCPSTPRATFCLGRYGHERG
jgi:hypothetical protein